MIGIHKDWWEAVFSKVSVWSPALWVPRRCVWLQVYGIPLHVWHEELFKMLGNLFGVFVDFDEDTILRNRLDFARIKISTTRMGIIDEHVRISVVGAVFGLWVVEEGGGRRWGLEAGEKVEVDGISVGSRYADVAEGDLRLSSDDEVNSPRSVGCVQLESPIRR